MAPGETQNGTAVPAKQTEKAPETVLNGNNTTITTQPAQPAHLTTNNVNQADKRKQVDANTAFLRAARAGDLEKLIEYLETGQTTDINTCNANGLNALHLAAKDGHTDIVKELLARGALVDNATKKGNTALHIASLAGQKDVIKLLIAHNANVNVQSQNGFTPLYMAAQENHDACVRYLLAKYANQTLSTEDGFTPLAVAMQQGHDKVVAVLLESDSRGKVRLPALHIAAKKDDVKAATLLLENEHNPDVASKSGFTPLHIAAHYGNVDIANLLIQKGADVNFAAKHNITPLHVACKWGKTNMVQLLIENGAKINSTTRDGLTPLHCAARSGHEQVIEMLLGNGAPILSRTKNGLAPLHMAAQGEHVDAARILLYNKAPVDEVTVDYLTALHVAAHCGHVKVAKLLLDRKADPNARALNGFTPLHIACKKNRIKVVELLLKHGASISATTESGLTPLHVASFMGCMNIVIYLLQHDASPDVPTVRGETALHLAARANQTDIIRILLRNGAQVDAKAREEQTPLHVASRLGIVDIVMLLLQHGANVDSVTKDLYTPLHIAAKEGQDEVAVVLIDHGASLDAATKKSFTPLHLAGKYGNIKVAQLLLQKGAPVDAQGKNGVTPLHVASHYDNQNVALLLLEKGASPHASAKNGHTPLHIAAKKNQMDIASTLLEYGGKPDAESKSGFTPLHLSAQEGHTEMTALLLEHKSDPNYPAKNGLTPLHLCAQEDNVSVANTLLQNQAQIDAITKSGYTPLHVASHFGQVNMVKFLLENDANIEKSTNIGYTPLHQAAQQGHTLIINLLLKHKANPNAVTNNGQTALNIANRLGYITVVESLKVVTETSITSTITGTLEEKYKVVAPETMHETFLSDSEDEGGEDPIMSDQQQYKYMTSDDGRNLDDNLKMDPSGDAGIVHEYMSQMHHQSVTDAPNNHAYMPKALDNVDIVRHPVHVGFYVLDTLEPCLEYFGGHIKTAPMSRERFLVSFLVDARGGAMRGCRHSGVRVIVPPKSAAQPTRITCRYVKPQRIPNPPPLMEGEALVSRILELGPVGAKFLGPVILEVPHFASLREKEREIIILRSDNGETWREHTLYDSDEAIQDVLNESFEAGELSQLEDLHTSRIIRVVTHDFPHFLAVVSRIRQEVHAIGPDGGTVSSAAVPQVQAVFPPNALTKKIRVGLQAQPIDAQTTAKLLGRGVAVSPVVTVEPRRRKFHKAITLSMPAPRAYTQGMINQYSGNAPTLRLLCSITGGQSRAVWEDVTGSTPLTFVKDCVSFTTTVSARFWLMDCRNIAEACKMATELYNYMAYVPFMVKFVVFAKRVDATEAKLSVFCMTDDKEDKTLEQQEHFTEVAKSRDVEVLEGRNIFLEFGGNLIPIHKSGDQLAMEFNAFKENRLVFTVLVKDQEEPMGRVSFMNEQKVSKGDPAQTPICTLNIGLPEKNSDYDQFNSSDRLHLNGSGLLLGTTPSADEIHKADIRLSDICNLLGSDWEKLARELEITDYDIELIKKEFAGKVSQQAMIMLRLWLRQSGKQGTGNNLNEALHKINRTDIVEKCVCNFELVTDEMEKTIAKLQLDQSGFDTLRKELDHDQSNKDLSMQSVNDTLDDSCIENGEPLIDDSTNAKPRVNVDIKITQTPPPSPAEADQNNHNNFNDKLPPTAEPEASDLTFIAQQDALKSSQPDILIQDEDQFDVGQIKRQAAAIVTMAPKIDDSIVELATQEAILQIQEDINAIFDTAEEHINNQQLPTAPPLSDEDDDGVDEEQSEQVASERHHGDEDDETSFTSDNHHSTNEGPTSIGDNFNDNDVSQLSMDDVAKMDTTDSSQAPVEKSKIPVAAKTSTPIKVKTIKKHSKVSREIVKPTTTRPTVGDIEWDCAKDATDGTVMEISTLTLEDVIADEMQTSTKPHFIITDDDDDNGVEHDDDDIEVDEDERIDEVILVQTPMHAVDMVDKYIVSESMDAAALVFGNNGEPPLTEKVVVITEEYSPDGDVIARKQTTTTTTTTASLSGGNTNASDEYPTNSFSVNSESDSESHGGGGGGSVDGNLQSAIKSAMGKTMRSSSGSDVALHEAGAELSDDQSETDFYQSNEQSLGFSDKQDVDQEHSDHTTATSNNDFTTKSDLQSSSQLLTGDGKDSLQKIVDNFVNEERKHQ